MSLHAQYVLGAVATLIAVTAIATWTISVRTGASRRSRAISALARGNGMSYTQYGSTGLGRAYRFALFHEADMQLFTNVVSGPWRGVPMVASDFWFGGSRPANPISTRRRRRKGKSEHLCVAVVGIGAKAPHVIVVRQSVPITVAEHLGLRDIPFESEAFNRMFRVKAKNARFATELIDPRMMEWLLSTGGLFGFEVRGEGAVAYCQFVGAEEFPALLDVAVGFAQHVPAMVTATPVSPSGTEGPSAPVVVKAADAEAMKEVEQGEA